jgi:hypothetical protein
MDSVPVPPVYSLTIVILLLLFNYVTFISYSFFFRLHCCLGLVSKHFTIRPTPVVFSACDKCNLINFPITKYINTLFYTCSCSFLELFTMSIRNQMENTAHLRFPRQRHLTHTTLLVVIVYHHITWLCL